MVCRGYNLMKGYLDEPAATAQAIDAEGCLHTGDLGVLDPRGYLRITRRLEDLSLAGGFQEHSHKRIPPGIAAMARWIGVRRSGV